MSHTLLAKPVLIRNSPPVSAAHATPPSSLEASSLSGRPSREWLGSSAKDDCGTTRSPSTAQSYRTARPELSGSWRKMVPGSRKLGTLRHVETQSTAGTCGSASRSSAGHRHDRVDLVGLETEPHIPVAPDHQVFSLRLYRVLLHSSCHSLKHLVVRVGS